MASAAAGGALVDESGARVTDAGYADRTWVDGWETVGGEAGRAPARGSYLIEDTPYQAR